MPSRVSGVIGSPAGPIGQPEARPQDRVPAHVEAYDTGEPVLDESADLLLQRLLGHAVRLDRVPSTLRIRWSLTFSRVPSCWAHSDTRYSSSSHRESRRCCGHRLAGRERGDAVQPGLLQPGELVHQLAVLATCASSRSRRSVTARR